MTVQQADRQATVRAATGTALTYEGDWHALFDQASIALGPFDQRMLAWINGQTVMNFASLPNAMQFFATGQGAFNWSSMGTFSIQGVAGVYLPQALGLFAQFDVQPSTARKSLINTCINGLINSGVWIRLDALWLLAAHDRQAARVCWTNPASMAQLVENGTLSFAIDKGFTSDGTTGYLATPYGPGFGGQMAVQNDNHIGEWVLTSTAVNVQIDFGNNFFSINARPATTTTLQVRDSSATSNVPVVAADTSIGHTLLTRAASTGFDVYKNAAFQVTQAQASSALTQDPAVQGGIAICARNNATVVGNYSLRQIAAVHAGKSLTPQNITDLYSALAAFMTALGN